MRAKFSKSDLAIATMIWVVGSLLPYVIWSSARPGAKWWFGCLGLGFVGIASWQLARRWQIRQGGRPLMKQTVLVGAQGSAEIVFSPKKPIADPVLFLRSYGKGASEARGWGPGGVGDGPAVPEGGRGKPQVVVVDILRNGVSLVFGPHVIEHWNRGVAYPGFLNVMQDAAGDEKPAPPLKILVQNLGTTSAVVYAHVSTLPPTTFKG